MKMSIGRTTVGEIVRGKYMPSDEWLFISHGVYALLERRKAP
jgi:hypothetical protein